MFLTILIITIHELGHFITAKLLNLNVKEIRIFMFGGVTILNEELNVDIKKEILTLLMGPITQLLFLIVIYSLYKDGYVSNLTYTKFYNINILLFSFNLLPILPLDGGKLVNNLFDLITSYNLSHKITIFISIISVPLIFTFDNKLIIIILFIFLIIQNIEEIKLHKYKINRFILERKLKYHKYKKIEEIKNINQIKRNKNFSIKVKGMLIEEQDYFNYMYQT